MWMTVIGVVAARGRISWQQEWAGSYSQNVQLPASGR